MPTWKPKLIVKKDGYGYFIGASGNQCKVNNITLEFMDYFVEDITDEKNIIKMMQKKYPDVKKDKLLADLQFVKTQLNKINNSTKTPTLAHLVLTYKCNNNCPWCFAKSLKKPVEELSFNQWKQVIDRLIDIGVSQYALTGGEPTESKDFLKVVEYLKDKKVGQHCISNGRNFGKNELAKRFRDAGGENIYITINSPDQKEFKYLAGGDYLKETVEGIRACTKAGLYVGTNTTLTKLNSDIETLKRLIMWLSTLGVRSIGFDDFICKGWEGNEIKLPFKEIGKLIEELEPIVTKLDIEFMFYSPINLCEVSKDVQEKFGGRCGAGFAGITVIPNGEVKPCQVTDFVCGNILKDKWEDIWNDERMVFFRTLKYIKEYAPKKCQKCIQIGYCSAGCPLNLMEKKNGIS